MDRLPLPSPRWALFLDLDGTLIDLAPRPDMVVVPAGMVAVLRRIEHGLAGALAIVSGRSLGQIDTLLAPWVPVAAGEHGAFCRLPSGAVVSPDPPTVPISWRNVLGALPVTYPGVLVEQKTSSIAVHYRLAPACEAPLRALMQCLAAEHAPKFVVTPAHMAWEIRPRGIHKGTAVHRLMRELPMSGRLPVFLGDDVTDEDGMQAAEAMGGIGVHVARCFPDGAAGVRAWLGAVAASLGAGPAR